MQFFLPNVLLKTRRGAAYRPHGFLQYDIDAKIFWGFITEFEFWTFDMPA